MDQQLNPQSFFTPVGLAKSGPDGLLVTNLRTIDNKTKNIFEKYAVLVDPTDINHKTVQANQNALGYYLGTKKAELEQNLLKKVYQKYLGRDYVFDWEFDQNKIPLQVAMEYNRSHVSYMNTCLLNYAEKQFFNYIWKIEHNSRYLCLESKDGLHTCYKKLETRYHNSYCKKIKKRMDWLAHEYGNSSAVLLTLTLDPKKFNNNKMLMWKSIKPLFHEFLKKLRIHFKRRGRVFPKYIHAVEGQKNGNPHLHVVFLQATRLTDWRRILKYWGSGAIYINRTKEGQKVRNPINYVCKYITKTFANTNFDNIRTQSLVWLFNMKSFDRSKGLIVPLNPKGCGDWLLSYLAIVERHDNMISEMAFVEKRIDVLLDPKLWVNPPPDIVVNPTGKYVIYGDGEGGVYSTDSLFWGSFFTEEDD